MRWPARTEERMKEEDEGQSSQMLRQGYLPCCLLPGRRLARPSLPFTLAYSLKFNCVRATPERLNLPVSSLARTAIVTQLAFIGDSKHDIKLPTDDPMRSHWSFLVSLVALYEQSNNQAQETFSITQCRVLRQQHARSKEVWMPGLFSSVLQGGRKRFWPKSYDVPWCAVVSLLKRNSHE